MRGYWIIGLAALSTWLAGNPSDAQSHLRYSDPSYLGVVWPYHARTIADERLLALIACPLWARDAYGQVPYSLIEPASFERVSDRELRFRLKKGLRWGGAQAGGRSIQATDVVATYRYLRETGDPSLGVVYLDAFSDIESIGSIPEDSLAVQVRFRLPRSLKEMQRPLINFFLLPGFLELRQPLATYIATHPHEPISYGRWTLAEVSEGGTVVELERNEGFSGPATPFAKITAYLDATDAQLYSQVMNANVDLAVQIPLHPQVVQQLQDRPGWVRFDHPANVWTMLAVNFGGTGNPALRDPRVREAIDLAIDREKIVTQFFSSRGEAISGPFTSSSPAMSRDCGPRPYDPDRAQELLRQAGFCGSEGPEAGGRPRLVLRILEAQGSSGAGDLPGIVHAIVSQLKQCGIEAERVPLSVVFDQDRDPWDLWYREVVSTPSWNCREFFHSRGTENRGAGGEDTRDAELDAMLDRFVLAGKSEEAWSIGAQIHCRMKETLPAIFLWAPRNMGLYQTGVTFVAAGYQLFADWPSWRLRTRGRS